LDLRYFSIQIIFIGLGNLQHNQPTVVIKTNSIKFVRVGLDWCHFVVRLGLVSSCHFL